MCLTKYVHMYVYEQGNQKKICMTDAFPYFFTYVFVSCICICGQDVATYTQSAFHWDAPNDYKTHHVAHKRHKHELHHKTMAHRLTAIKLKMYDRCKNSLLHLDTTTNRGQQIISNIAVKHKPNTVHEQSGINPIETRLLLWFL